MTEWTFLRENREAVAEKLRRGEYDGLVQTGLGRADELVYLMASLKFFEHLDNGYPSTKMTCAIC